jgi:hypothetical protein
MDASIVTSLGVGTVVDFVLEMDNVNKGTNDTIAGQGYIIRSNLRVPRDGLIADEIEIEVDGRPTVR